MNHRIWNIILDIVYVFWKVNISAQVKSELKKSNQTNAYILDPITSVIAIPQ